ncbi:MAG: hypothetical protein AAGA28_01405 [Pseudomonadota bacterium]
MAGFDGSKAISEATRMEVLGTSHPVVSKSAAIQQLMQDQSRAAQAESSSDAEAAAGRGVLASPETDIRNPVQTVRPATPTSESLLEARTPVEADVIPSRQQNQTAPDAETAPESETYQFPEELPMNIREVIDMLRGDRAPSVPGAAMRDVLLVNDPAGAAEAQRLNRTA